MAAVRGSMRNRFASSVVVLAAVAALAACSPFAFVNSMVPQDGHRRIADIPYGALARQKLDVYVPLSAADGDPLPVVVFFYGGGWAAGERAEYLFVAEAITSQGFVAVLPDYRIHPEARFPNFVLDGASAVRWVRDNVARFGGDPRRLFLMGHSAGAHLAAMLTLDRQHLESVGMAPADLRGVIGLAGPYVHPYLPTRLGNGVFGPEAGRWRSRPINFVDGRNPPMLLLTGADDGIVKPSDSRRLAAKIGAHGGPVEVIEYPGLAHADVIARLAAPLRGDAEILRDVARFVREHAVRE